MSYAPGSNGNLSGLGDVALNNTLDGQGLVYSTSSGKWSNGGTIHITAVPSSQTSYIATVSDVGADIEMYSNTVGGSGNSSGTNTVIIQPQGTGSGFMNWPSGANFNVRQMSPDITSIVAGSSAVNILAPNGTRIANPYMTATVVRSSQDTWVVDGGVST